MCSEDPCLAPDSTPWVGLLPGLVGIRPEHWWITRRGANSSSLMGLQKSLHHEGGQCSQLDPVWVVLYSEVRPVGAEKKWEAQPSCPV